MLRYDILKHFDWLINLEQGSGCGAVGRAVASNSRGPRFESSHRQKFIEHLLSTVFKRRKEKRGREWPMSFLKKI